MKMVEIDIHSILRKQARRPSRRKRRTYWTEAAIGVMFASWWLGYHFGEVLMEWLK